MGSASCSQGPGGVAARGMSMCTQPHAHIHTRVHTHVHVHTSTCVHTHTQAGRPCTLPALGWAPLAPIPLTIPLPSMAWNRPSWASGGASMQGSPVGNHTVSAEGQEGLRESVGLLVARETPRMGGAAVRFSPRGPCHDQDPTVGRWEPPALLSVARA